MPRRIRRSSNSGMGNPSACCCRAAPAAHAWLVSHGVRLRSCTQDAWYHSRRGAVLHSPCESCPSHGALFGDFHSASEACGSPARALEAQVLIRFVPAVMVGAAVLAAVPNTECDFNSLQAYWARTTVGHRRGPRLNWVLSRPQCRWDLGLGTRMFLQVIMARSRLWVLLEGHPAMVMRDAARVSPASTSATLPTRGRIACLARL